MLILLRKPGQSIVIEGGIRLTVLDVDGERVRLGIEAPARTRILREELVEAISAENRAAALVAGHGDLPALLRSFSEPPALIQP